GGRAGSAAGADHRQDRLGRVPSGVASRSGWVASEVTGHQGPVSAQELVDPDKPRRGAHRGPDSGRVLPAAGVASTLKDPSELRGAGARRAW
ncbi:MAG: hypothetical protein WBP28_11905, partial [Nostocoides sp.]